MHDGSRFLSWVVEPWTRVSNVSMFSVQLSMFEVVSLLGLQTSSFTILLWPPLIFILSSDVHIIFLLLSTDSSCGPITNASDWSMLSRDKFVLKSCSLEFVKKFATMSASMFVSLFVMNWVLPCPMIPIPMTSGSRDPTQTDKLQTLSTMWVSFIGYFLASTWLLESLIVSTCSSDSWYTELLIVNTYLYSIGNWYEVSHVIRDKVHANVCVPVRNELGAALYNDYYSDGGWLRYPTPTDKLQTLSTMWVSFIGSFLASTCLMESLIVSTCSSDS